MWSQIPLILHLTGYFVSYSCVHLIIPPSFWIRGFILTLNVAFFILLFTSSWMFTIEAVKFQLFKLDSSFSWKETTRFPVFDKMVVSQGYPQIYRTPLVCICFCLWSWRLGLKLISRSWSLCDKSVFRCLDISWSSYKQVILGC